ncbi:MAG: hypothetical protein EKK41_25715 [Hyphomicrobiales bacterium]|nr:MAG: hypothetical protein EKK41_25715 [Hyphomicrobiales bacterium]
MKALIGAMLATSVLLTTAAVAQQASATPTNKADCEKAKMKWDDKGGKDGKGACLAAKATETPKK